MPSQTNFKNALAEVEKARDMVWSTGVRNTASGLDLENFDNMLRTENGKMSCLLNGNGSTYRRFCLLCW